MDVSAMVLPPFLPIFAPRPRTGIEHRDSTPQWYSLRTCLRLFFGFVHKDDLIRVLLRHHERHPGQVFTLRMWV